MTLKDFRVQAKAMGFDVRKRYGLEMLDIEDKGTFICSVSYAELYPVDNAAELLCKKLRPEYVPPLG